MKECFEGFKKISIDYALRLSLIIRNIVSFWLSVRDIDWLCYGLCDNHF